MQSFTTCVILHIAQQLCSRKPPFFQPVNEKNNEIPLALEKRWDLFNWLAAIEHKCAANSKISQWLTHYFPCIASKINLANIIKNHFVQIYKTKSTYITLADSNLYPKLLKEIPDPPLALSAIGLWPDTFDRSVSVIGSRKASAYSIGMAKEIGKALTKSETRVVSGGAYGCDIAAHIGCLSNDSKTVPTATVFSGGLGCLYPKGNQSTFKNLLQRGGVFISEKLWFYQPKPFDFPIRNRIIAGLTPTTIMVHADVKSGAMLTCNQALNFNREVIVLSPKPQDLTMKGNLSLIEDGAKSFYSPSELLEII